MEECVLDSGIFSVTSYRGSQCANLMGSRSRAWKSRSIFMFASSSTSSAFSGSDAFGEAKSTCTMHNSSTASKMRCQIKVPLLTSRNVCIPLHLVYTYPTLPYQLMQFLFSAKPLPRTLKVCCPDSLVRQSNQQVPSVHSFKDSFFCFANFGTLQKRMKNLHYIGPDPKQNVEICWNTTVFVAIAIECQLFCPPYPRVLVSGQLNRLNRLPPWWSKLPFQTSGYTSAIFCNRLNPSLCKGF